MRKITQKEHLSPQQGPLLEQQHLADAELVHGAALRLQAVQAAALLAVVEAVPPVQRCAPATNKQTLTFSLLTFSLLATFLLATFFPY